jgi:nucleoside-diphosphate-sugar epimerase
MTRDHPAPPRPRSPAEDEEALEDCLSEPSPALIDSFRALAGDLLILGAGGKMGPSLCRMAVRAGRAAGTRTRVVAVSRFSDAQVRQRLERGGVETIACDLLAPGALARLPRLDNVVYMPARKFGSAGAEAETWATNAYLPGEVARAFPAARIVAFSTGNVYPLWPAPGPGPGEDAPIGPVGEYAQSCLGRERVLEHFSRHQGTPMTLLRLNYAVELRYGVLADLATKIAASEPIDLTTGYANVIWQGDANAYALQAFALCASPPAVLNVTGPLVAIREVAAQLARRLGRAPRFTGAEAPTALLSDPARCHRLLGPPRVSLGELLDWVAAWVQQGGRSLGKPTKFEVRDGRF